MRYILILVLFTTIIFAKETHSCYTVQLVSKYNNQKNMETLLEQKYPQSCLLMEIGTSITVRCGCYDKIKDAKEKLPVLQDSYKNAYIATTYKYRFENNDKNTTAAIKAVSDEIKSPIKPAKEVQSVKKSKESCHTIQLISYSNTQKNRNILSKKTFPKPCVLMEIGNTLTVRCGCYENASKAKKDLPIYKDEHALAYIATTYKYRFGENYNISQPSATVDKVQDTPYVEQTSYVKQTSYGTSEEELRLMLQTFLYAGEIENAYKVASIGYKKNPDSYYWNQKMAEISRWTGRTNESVGYMLFLYNVNHDEKMQDDIIKYATSVYRYEDIEDIVTDKAVKNPTDENIQNMIAIYNKTGSPEKAAVVLENEYKKDNTKDKFLTEALNIYLNMGDLESAKGIVEIMQREELYSLDNTSLISSYYYLNGDMKSAYEILLVTKDDKKDTDIKFNKKLSDLSWYMQDYTNGAEASQRLMKMDKARLIDYERIIFMYQNKDLDIVYEASKKAYDEHKLTYLFYGYADSAIILKKYKELRSVTEEIDKTDSPLKNDTMYWIIKAKIYGHFNEMNLKREALQVAISMNPDNVQTKITMFWFFMENSLDSELKKLLLDMSESADLNPTFYMPIASAYLYLNDINKANFYAQKLISQNNPIIKTIDFKFFTAYVYQAQDYEQRYTNEMIKILDDLKKKVKKNKKLYKNKSFLNYYLRAAIVVMKPDKFEKKLSKAKPYLDKKDYQEISYSWAIQNSAFEKSHYIFNQIQKRELWLRFSNAQVFQNHTELENVLDEHKDKAPLGNVSQVALEDGQIALAQQIAYDSFNRNSYSLDAYNQHLNISRKRSDELQVKVANYNRNPLEQQYVKIQNTTYVPESWNFLTNVNYFENSIINNTELKYVPDTIFQAGFGVKKLFTRATVEANVRFNDAMESYISYSLLGDYRLVTDLVIRAGYEKNKDALDTIQLMLAGKKDTITLGLTWNMFESTIVDAIYEINDYSSQDEVDVGDGDYARVSILRQFRNGYPDWSMGLYAEMGKYDENYGYSGVLDQIDNGLYPVLSEDFFTLGASFALGMQNASAYTRVWRPYIEVSPYYNTTLKTVNFNVNAGYGGKVFHQDHLSIGVDYSETVYGYPQTVIEFYLNYQFLYAHP